MFLLPDVKPGDPLTLAAVVGVLTMTGLLASWGPVRKATRVEPMTALRYE